MLIAKLGVKEMMRAVLFLFSLLCVAPEVLGGELNLLLQNEKEPVSVELSIAEMSNTICILKELGEALNGTSLEKPIPLMGVNLSTWKAIENSLRAMQKLKAEGTIYDFRSLKEMVKSSFQTDAPPTSIDILNFLLAANYLDIPDLLRPAAAVWVDLVKQEEHKKEVVSVEDTLEKFKAKQEELSMPDDLFAYVEDYINPALTIKKSGQLEVAKSQSVLIKAYDTISVIDIATNEVADSSTPEDAEDPNILSIEAGELQNVVNRADKTITATDPKTHQTIGPITIGNAPEAIIIAGDFFLVVNWDISVSSAKYSFSHIYNPNDHPIDRKYNAYILADDKFYAIESEVKDEYTLSVFDLTTDQIIGTSLLATTTSPISLIVAGDKLLVVERGQMISIFDLKQFLYYTSK